MEKKMPVTFIHAFDPNNVAISSLEIVLQVLFATL
jgi:hypothetical protein